MQVPQESQQSARMAEVLTSAAAMSSEEPVNVFMASLTLCVSELWAIGISTTQAQHGFFVPRARAHLTHECGGQTCATQISKTKVATEHQPGQRLRRAEKI
jgi:hypothetical protein